MAPLLLEGCHLGYLMLLPHSEVHDVYVLRLDRRDYRDIMDDFSVYGSSIENCLENLSMVL